MPCLSSPASVLSAPSFVAGAYSGMLRSSQYAAALQSFARQSFLMFLPTAIALALSKARRKSGRKAGSFLDIQFRTVSKGI